MQLQLQEEGNRGRHYKVYTEPVSQCVSLSGELTMLYYWWRSFKWGCVYSTICFLNLLDCACIGHVATLLPSKGATDSSGVEWVLYRQYGLCIRNDHLPRHRPPPRPLISFLTLKGPLDCAIRTIRQKGPKGLYVGLSPWITFALPRCLLDISLSVEQGREGVWQHSVHEQNS